MKLEVVVGNIFLLFFLLLPTITAAVFATTPTAVVSTVLFKTILLPMTTTEAAEGAGRFAQDKVNAGESSKEKKGRTMLLRRDFIFKFPLCPFVGRCCRSIATEEQDTC